MASLYDVSAEAQNDLFEIWRRIAKDSADLANRIEKPSVLFFPLCSFLVVYQPDAKPILRHRVAQRAVIDRVKYGLLEVCRRHC